MRSLRKLEAVFDGTSLLALTTNDWIGRIVLAAALTLGTALRVWLCFNDDGIYWPDEIYQSLEPAHRLVFGHGLAAWEFVEGARNWAFPGFVAGLLKASGSVGLDDPRGYLSVVRLAFSGIGVATAWGSYLLARRLGASPLFAACGAAFFALAAPAIYFAPRSMSESASALPVVLGLALVLPTQADRRERLVGASLLGLAVMLRLQVGVLCLALLGVQAFRRQWRQAAELTAVWLCWAAVYALVDKLTWGDWAQSALVYLHANSLPIMAPVTGLAPAEYYAVMSLRAMPVAAAVVAELGVAGAIRARGLAFVITAFVVVHTLLPHKEYRYIVPVLPLLGALAGVGLDVLWRSGRRKLTSVGVAGLLLGVLWSGTQFRALTFGHIGPYEKSRPADSAYDDRGPVNRLLIAAQRQPDLCGLRIETDHLVWTGGYSYLHRPVPLYSLVGPPRESGLYNYVIASRGQEAAEIVAIDGDRALARLPIVACSPDPAYNWELPGVAEVRRAMRSRPPTETSPVRRFRRSRPSGYPSANVFHQMVASGTEGPQSLGGQARW